ncbi:MAG: NuoM family protein [Phycisphaerae bacterium]
MDGLLVAIILAPLVGALVCATIKNGVVAQYWALGTSLFTLALAVVLAFGIDMSFADVTHANAGLQVAWENELLTLSNPNVAVSLGADTVSVWLVLLTTFLMPIAVAASFYSIRQSQTQYYAWMLALLSFMVGVFFARDLLLFYVFFELTLVPMFFIIGIWGGEERRYAAGKFFLYTFAGSVFTLAASIYLGVRAGTFDISVVTQFAQQNLTSTQQFWVLMGLLAGFAVKVPLFPVHTWLPLAHTQAPTAGSIILAGVLLKLGTYGLMRLAFPIGMINEGGVAFPVTLQVIAVLCIIGIIYGALVAWVQTDIKKLVAYSSVSHLGFCVLGLVALNVTGFQGSVLYMINHGISTGAMFLVIGMIYDRYHTREMAQLSGLAKQMPVLAFFFVLFVMSSIGLPGTNGFVSEFLTVLGAFTSGALNSPWYGITATIGVVLGALYMLHMTAKVMFGPLKFPHHHDEPHDPSAPVPAPPLPKDVNARELSLLVPLAVVVIVLGIFPTPVLKSLVAPVQMMITPVPMLEVEDVSALEAGALEDDAVASKAEASKAETNKAETNKAESNKAEPAAPAVALAARETP